jgi:hypothetical protein
MGAAQVFGQVTACPQLFVAGPHAFPAQVTASVSGAQGRLCLFVRSAAWFPTLTKGCPTAVVRSVMDAQGA